MAKTYLVTGGSGFLGAALVRALVRQGNRVRVFDNDARGYIGRLADIFGCFEHVPGDIRDADAVDIAVKGVDSVCHLAFVNGTSLFYSQPELVLDVGVKGIINILDSSIRHRVPEFLLMSSSEVYQEPPEIPTSETVPLSIPDPLNPRYSYAGGKIISELLALNQGRKQFERLLVVRPHNVYGPDMGWDHVIPQFVLRMKQLIVTGQPVLQFPIQGTGEETRSFVFVDDFTEGLLRIFQAGVHMGIYNIGTTEEVTIRRLAQTVGEYFGKQVIVVAGAPSQGSARRRCPDISRAKALGYEPKVCLADGLAVTARWYDTNSHRAPVGLGIEALK